MFEVGYVIFDLRSWPGPILAGIDSHIDFQVINYPKVFFRANQNRNRSIFKAMKAMPPFCPIVYTALNANFYLDYFGYRQKCTNIQNRYNTTRKQKREQNLDFHT